MFVNSFKDSESADIRMVVTSDKVEVYYAQGDTWFAVMGDSEVIQRQILNDAGQRTTAEAVVAAIGGQVVNITP